MRVGVIGYGIIGKAVTEIFIGKVDLFVYDISLSSRDKYFLDSYSVDWAEGGPINTAAEKLEDCDALFVCVPTPHKRFEGLDMSIIEEVVFNFNPKLFIICSALQPGTADRLMAKYSKRIVVQPEYFGETVSHPLVDLSSQKFLILGGTTDDVNKSIAVYQKVYNANIRIRKVTALEAEIIKLSENRAIAFKVAQCQELYDACIKAGVDYETIRQAVYGDDPRFNLWWTFVFPDDRGFNSKCIPKDVFGWTAWADEIGADTSLVRSVLKYNEKLRKE